MGNDQIGIAAMADAPEVAVNTSSTPEAVLTPEQAAVVAEAAKPLGENGEKALKAERDARKAAEKATADLAARLKQFEDRDKTEAERQADRLATLTQERDSLAADRARYRAALEHGLSKDDLDLLGPGDDIAERAALLAKRLGSIPVAPQRLPESPNAGRDAQQTDDDALYAAFKSSVFPTHQ